MFSSRHWHRPSSMSTMKPKQSATSSSSIRQFGQRSILSIFDPQVVEKKTSKASSSSVSMLDFLDKRLEKRSEKTPQGSTDDKRPSAIASPIPRVLSGRKSDLQPSTSIASSVFQQLKPVPKALKQLQGDSNPPANPPDDPINRRNSLKRKNFSSTDAEAFRLAREELFSYTHLIFNNPPTTLAKTIQLTGMLKKMLDEANNLHVTDFDFTRGRHRPNNVVSMVPAMQQSPTMAITQDQREMQDHPTLPAMPGNYRISGEASSSTMTDHLWKDLNSSGNQ